MRIIAGEFRGRRILPPQGEQTRPVTDRVKQSVFDVIAQLIEGSRVYDCFAGTGSFGLEALSRGAAHTTFFESHRPTVRLLMKNIETLKVTDRSTIISTDVFTSLDHPPGQADMIFFDPPYRFLRERVEELQMLARRFAHDHLSSDGMVIFRHDASDQLTLEGFKPFDLRTYGAMTVEWLRKE